MNFSNTLKIASIDLFPIRAKGGVSPQMAIGSMPTRPALLIRITDSDGCFSWGEVWANFPPRANVHKAHLIEDVVAPKLSGMSFTEPREVKEQLQRSLSVYFLHVGQSRVFEHILAGIDIALWDLALRKADQSFAAFMNLPETSAPTYASSINTVDLDRLIPIHSGMGQKHFKLKIGFLKDGDLGIVEKATTLCPKGARLMVDSNQSWNLEQAKTTLNALEEFNFQFAEEPLRADTPKKEWEALANATSIPLAGGENIYGVEEFLDFANTGMKYLQPDVAKWGGVTGALDLAEKLPKGCHLWPHFMGTAVGQMAALNVTAAVGGTSVCEMDVNENSLRTELCGSVLDISNGRVELNTQSGLVVPPLQQVLDDVVEHF